MADQGTSSTSTDESDSSPELHDPTKIMTAPKTKKSKVKANHPKTAAMVTEAITRLSQRNGSSLGAIKKYITNTYSLDTDKYSYYIKKYLKSAVAEGSLIQTKGRGATGSFKIAPDKKKSTMRQQTIPNKNLAAPKKTASDNVAIIGRKKQSSKKVKKTASADVQNLKSTKQNMKTPSPPNSPSRTKKITKSPTGKSKVIKSKKIISTSKTPKAVIVKKMTVVKK